MNTAIDFYSRGKEKEAEANDYTLPGYYPAGRFICPECGEEVFLSRSKYKNFFKHRKRTDQTPECERRVDSVSVESIYERIGLPLYLKEDTPGYFKLYIGFQPLSPSEIEQAERKGAQIWVDGKVKYNVTRERFPADHSLWVPISFTPYADHFNISYIGDRDCKAIFERRWGGYCEAFMTYGALFRAEHSSGRKFHKGDSIATGTDYYWVVPNINMLSGRKGLSFWGKGKLMLENRTFDVTQVSFGTDMNDAEYSDLAFFLLKELKLHLLEKAPVITPVWPPAAKQQDRYLVDEKTASVFGYVESGNTFPRIYGYYRDNPVPDFIIPGDESVAKLSLPKSHQYFTVDRRNVSTGLIIEKSRLHADACIQDIEIRINGSHAELPGRITTDEKVVALEATRKIDTIIKRRNQLEFYPDCDEVTIPNFSSGVCALFVYGADNLLMLEKTEASSEARIPEEINGIIKKYGRTYMVPIPFNVRKLLSTYSSSPLIYKMLSENRLPLAVVRYLERL